MVGFGVLGVVLAATLISEEPPDPGPGLEAPPPPPTVTRESPYLRTFLETTLLLGAGTLWYWHSPSLTDAELKWDWPSWQAKLFSTKDIVWDSNLFDTNVVAHPRAGFAYYQIARGNGFGVAGSFLSSFLASAAWEYFSEFIEKPSLNDLIFTPVGGTVIGEAAYQVGRYFAEGPPNAINQLGALIFSPVETINGWTSGDKRRAHGASRGQRAWHHFELVAGGGRSAFSNGKGSDDVVLAAGDRIVANHYYLRAGTGTVPVSPGDWTDIAARLLLDDGKTAGVNFHAQMILWGRYLRSYVPTSNTETVGWSVMTGLGSSFDYDNRKLPYLRDRIGSIGIVGPTFEVERHTGTLRVRAGASSHWGLAEVQSLAWPSVAPELNGVIVRESLREQGYYYAQGLISSASVAAEYANVELALSGRFDAFWSIDARDRIQREIQNNVSLNDERAYLAATLSSRPWPGPFRVVTGVERAARRGHLLGETVAIDETRATVSAAVTF